MKEKRKRHCRNADLPFERQMLGIVRTYDRLREENARLRSILGCIRLAEAKSHLSVSLSKYQALQGKYRQLRKEILGLKGNGNEKADNK